MSETAPASNEFVPFVTAAIVRAEAIAGLLRHEGYEVRLEPAADAQGATAASVRVLESDLKAIRDRGPGVYARFGVKWKHRFDRSDPQCAKCGCALRGEGGQCPECGSWFLLPSNEPLENPPAYDNTKRGSEVVHAPVAQARFITLMLREKGIEASLAVHGTDGDPDRRASVMAPRPSFSEARSALELAQRSGVRWRLEDGTPTAICTGCDRPIEGPESAGRCPVCHQWVILPDGVPDVSAVRRQQREELHESLVAGAGCVASLVGLGALLVMLWMVIWG